MKDILEGSVHLGPLQIALGGVTVVNLTIEGTETQVKPILYGIVREH